MKVVTINLWCEPPDRHRRIRDATTHLLKLLPDVVFIQEIPQGDSRQYLKSRLGSRYEIFYSKNESTYPPMSYLPFVVVFLSMLLGFHMTLRKSLLASMLVSPRSISMLISLVLSRKITDINADFMGTGILIKKDVIRRGKNKNVKIVSKPFSHQIRGYPVPESILSLGSWFKYYLQHTIGRPGVLMIRVETEEEGSFVLANCHLVISKDGSTTNSTREVQVEKVLNWVEEMRENRNDGIVIAGDFNAVPSGREQKKMKKAGYIESFQGRPMITWDPGFNSYTITHHEPRSQLDYVYVKQDHLKIMKARRVFDGKAGPIVSDHYGIEAELCRVAPRRTTTTRSQY